MQDNKFNISVIMQPLLFMLPLLLGFPFITFCLCAFNAAMTIIGSGPVYGAVSECVSAAAAVLLCSVLGYGTAYGAFFAAQIVLVSVFCALSILLRRSFGEGLLMCSVGYGLPLLMNLKYEASKSGVSIADSLTGELFGRMQGSLSISEQTGLEPSALENIYEALKNALRICLPAIIIIGVIASAYVVMWMVSRALRITPLSNAHSFSKIRLSKPAVVYAALMLAALFVPHSAVRMVAANGLLIFLFFAFAAGMSLVDFLLRIKIKSSTVRIFIHTAIIILSMLMSAVLPFNIFIIYILAGITDCFISVREKVAQPNEEK